MAGEEERQPEEQGVIGELEEAEGDGVRSHGGDSESLNGRKAVVGGNQKGGMVKSKSLFFASKKEENIRSVYVYDRLLRCST